MKSDLARKKENLKEKKRIYKICILDFYYAQNTLQYNTKEILTGAPIIFYSKRGGGVRIGRGKKVFGTSYWENCARCASNYSALHATLVRF